MGYGLDIYQDRNGMDRTDIKAFGWLVGCTDNTGMTVTAGAVGSEFMVGPFEAVGL
jgi:hypothetical protein